MSSLDINHVNGSTIMLDFIDGADPTDFSGEGLFNINSFLVVSDSANFLTDFGDIFARRYVPARGRRSADGCADS